jgi:hypothetical protein
MQDLRLTEAATGVEASLLFRIEGLKVGNKLTRQKNPPIENPNTAPITTPVSTVLNQLSNHSITICQE